MTRASAAALCVVLACAACAENVEGLGVLSGAWRIQVVADGATTQEDVQIDVNRSLVTVTAVKDGNLAPDDGTWVGQASGDAADFEVVLDRNPQPDGSADCELAEHTDTYAGWEDGNRLKGAYTGRRTWRGSACGAEQPTASPAVTQGSFQFIPLSEVTGEPGG